MTSDDNFHVRVWTEVLQVQAEGKKSVKEAS